MTVENFVPNSELYLNQAATLVAYNMIMKLGTYLTMYVLNSGWILVLNPEF